MAKPQQKTSLNIVMGAATFGEPGKDGTVSRSFLSARVHDLKDVNAILDVFQAHGHYEVDTSRIYTGGTSEEYLAKAGWKERGLLVDTKVFPNVGKAAPVAMAERVSHSPEDLRKHLEISLKALGTDSVEVFYLHSPDRTTPYEDTLRGVHALYEEGKFRRFGLSNFASWEVAEIVAICRAMGYVAPTVYQGVYNAIHRKVEPELFPCLRKFGIAFYAFNPLAGGFFTGKYASPDAPVAPGSRFDPSKGMGQLYRARYWSEPYFRALAHVEGVARERGLGMAEVALRWLAWHSLLTRGEGDAVLVGASSVGHVEQNLADLEKGPLPEEVVKALDKAWLSVSPYATDYFHK
ncbi:Aldo/keto reductase [Trametes sanguinea]|nr:Aldo/keto reductase [Trametes sanguinea]